MKKILTLITVSLLFSLSLNAQTTIKINQIDSDKKSVKFDKKVDDFKGVTVVDLSKSTSQNPVNINLEQFAEKDVQIDLYCKMKIVDKTGSSNKISWVINDMKAGFPELYLNKTVKSGEWITVKGSKFLHLTGKRNLYISGAGLKKENLTIYIKDLEVKVTGDELGTPTETPVSWTSGPSLKKELSPYFDYFGIAVTWQNEFSKANIQKGIAYQADSITTGNEFKPDFIFRWQVPKSFVKFTGENGTTIDVPAHKLTGFETCANIMQTAKDNGLEMRGHVLVWHSQTPKWFFTENYSAADNAKYVDKKTMNARMEWYIKTMMDFVNTWEKENNGGKHIIKTWDVVNEACSDNATASKWLRENSDWYKIYQSEEFIVNAFRYANKYAPKDVLLAYNDYNCYQGSNASSGGKTNAILNVIDAIQKTPDARIDIIGMQSHVQIGWPKVTGPDSFETAVQKFLEKGVNVQITELDIANGDNPYSSTQLRLKYKEYFQMFIKNRKTSSQRGITGVTVWGISDDGTWLNALEMYKGKKQYPLLFTPELNCKPAVFGIVEAAQEAK